MGHKTFVATINIAFSCDPEKMHPDSAVYNLIWRMAGGSERDLTFLDWEYAQQMNEEGNHGEPVELTKYTPPDGDVEFRHNMPGRGDIFVEARGEGACIGGDTSGPLIRLINKLYLELDGAESFISGFEDDDVQEGVDDMLEDIRTALEEAKPYYIPDQVPVVTSLAEAWKFYTDLPADPRVTCKAGIHSFPCYSMDEATKFFEDIKSRKDALYESKRALLDNFGVMGGGMLVNEQHRRINQQLEDLGVDPNS